VIRPLLCAAAVLTVLAACPGIGPENGEEDARLVPPGDPDFDLLERPEEPGECEDDAGCEISCVHGCVPVNEGPVTCPNPPPPKPARVEGARCLCEDSVCAYFE
jgi:hypothetical protein